MKSLKKISLIITSWTILCKNNNFPEDYTEIKEEMMDVLETKYRGPAETFEKIVNNFDEIGSTYGKSQDLIIFNQKQHTKVYWFYYGRNVWLDWQFLLGKSCK